MRILLQNEPIGYLIVLFKQAKYHVEQEQEKNGNIAPATRSCSYAIQTCLCRCSQFHQHLSNGYSGNLCIGCLNPIRLIL